MTRHVTAGRLVESAIKAVTEELFRDFDNTLRTLCGEENDRKAVFRAPALCACSPARIMRTYLERGNAGE